MLMTILIVLLILVVIGAIPSGPGYITPQLGGGVGLIIVILLILVLMGKL